MKESLWKEFSQHFFCWHFGDGAVHVKTVASWVLVYNTTATSRQGAKAGSPRGEMVAL